MSDTDDIVAIQQLLAHHNAAVDSGDGPRYAATWTDDGTAVTPNGSVTGREALAALGASAAQTVPGLRHWTTNHAIVVDGDRATTTLYLVATAGDPPSVVTTGRYTEELTRTPLGWRYARRVFTPDSGPDA